jgi:hypothetical protein
MNIRCEVKLLHFRSIQTPQHPKHLLRKDKKVVQLHSVKVRPLDSPKVIA